MWVLVQIQMLLMTLKKIHIVECMLMSSVIGETQASVPIMSMLL